MYQPPIKHLVVIVVLGRGTLITTIDVEEVSHDKLVFPGSPFATTLLILAATFKSTATFPSTRAEAPLLAHFLPLLFLTRFILNMPITIIYMDIARALTHYSYHRGFDMNMKRVL